MAGINTIGKRWRFGGGQPGTKIRMLFPARLSVGGPLGGANCASKLELATLASWTVE